MKLQLKQLLGIMIPVSMIVYNLNWKIGGIIIALTVLISLILKLKSKAKKGLTLYWSLYILIFAIILQILRTPSFTISYLVGYILSFVLLLFGLSEYDIKVAVSLLKTISLIEALSVFLQILFPSIYSALIGVLVEPATKISILSRVNEGYYTGFSREVSLTTAFLVIGLGIYYSELFYSQDNNSKKRRRNSFISFFIIVAALLFTGKKAQPLFALISIGVTYLFYSNKRWKILRTTLIISVVLAIIVGTYSSWKNIPSLARYASWIDSYLVGRDIAILTTGRTEIYNTAINLWNNNRLFGIGWNNFKNSVPQTFWYSRFDVHNCYLQVLCETGYLGAILYYILLVVTIIRLIYCAYLGREQKLTPVFAFCIYYIVFFLLYSITGTVLYEYSYYIIFFGCIVLLEMEIRQRRNIHRELNSSQH